MQIAIKPKNTLIYAYTSATLQIHCHSRDCGNESAVWHMSLGYIAALVCMHCSDGQISNPNLTLKSQIFET